MLAEPLQMQRDWTLGRFLAGELAPSALFNHSSISIISVLLTYRCPAACSHCVFESSPTNRTTLDMALAFKLVEAASRQSPPPVLGFSGGEAFLRLREMRELASFASSRGMSSEVISSSAWAKSEAYAEEVLTDLRGAGLTTYCTSVDKFHIPFIRPEKMRWALRAAKRVGLKTVINFQAAADHPPEREGMIAAIAGMLGVGEAEVEEHQINPLVTVPVGRARAEVDGFHYDDRKDMLEGCPMATEIVTLSPYGLLYPCCGMVVGEKIDSADLFIQDSLHDRTVDEIADILHRLKSDLFFKLLQAVGPLWILRELHRRDPSIRIADRYVGSCDVCLEFTQNPRVAAAARELMREFSDVLRRAPAGAAPIAAGLAATA